MKAKKFFPVWVYFIFILGASGGATLIYAEEHPSTKIYKIVTNLGFHLRK